METPRPSILPTVLARVKASVAALGDGGSARDMESLLRYLAKWRSQMLANTYIAHHGVTVLQGPFAGMQYLDKSTEGALIARLLGCYESELHPHIAAIMDAGVDCMIDVGCAEGYYAVGLARRYPGLQVHARDIQAFARASCEELARRNGVSDRVIVGGEFLPTDFEAYADRRVLVFVDAEGAEVDVLRPDLSPALARMHLIVETHDGARPGALTTMIQRFEPTHHVTRVDQAPKSFDLPPWLKNLSHLDQVLATWEWRAQPTPWLVMRPKAG